MKQVELLELLGLKTDRLSKAVLTFTPGSVVEVEATYSVLLKDDADEMEHITRKFQLIDVDAGEGLREAVSYVADCLDSGERQGDDEDVPEGSKYITMSDTLAKELAAKLREATL
jgi:hypothetical protein